MDWKCPLNGFNCPCRQSSQYFWRNGDGENDIRDQHEEIVIQIDMQNKLGKSEAVLVRAPAQAVSTVKNMNLLKIPRKINIGDISVKLPNLPSFT